MRSLLLSGLAATTIIAATSIGLTTDASAAARRPHHHARVVPYVRQDPSGAFNQFSAPVLPDPALTDRWPPSGGAT